MQECLKSPRKLAAATSIASSSPSTKSLPAIATSLVVAFAGSASRAAETAPATANTFSVAAGAYHWFNLPSHGGDLTYGTKGLPDTYRWDVLVDGEHRFSTDNALGFHGDIRYRENGKLRSFIPDELWTWETYAYAKTGSGTFKGGKVWSRFGLDWDGSFYGNVQYFDGLKLDPDWGVTWENSWKASDVLSVDTNAQFFFAEDQVNGSIAGGDTESADNWRERNTAIVRVVPRLKLDDKSSLAVGLSARAGKVDVKGGGDHSVSGGAIDLTYANRGFKVYAEADAINGRTNPAHYVTGGPSDGFKDYLAGAEYTFKPAHFVGPTTLRYTYSRGEYDDPDGTQNLRLVGVTTQFAKYFTFYVEYVNWDVNPVGAASSKYEDSFQFVLYWNIGKTFNF